MLSLIVFNFETNWLSMVKNKLIGKYVTIIKINIYANSKEKTFKVLLLRHEVILIS